MGLPQGASAICIPYRSASSIGRRLTLEILHDKERDADVARLVPCPDSAVGVVTYPMASYGRPIRPMTLSPSRRALWLLLALIVLAPPVATFLLRPPTDLLARALRSIPAPQPVEIRPRLFVAYGALVATSTLGILYLYRGRSFVVYWIVSWSMLAASYTLNGRGYADARIGSVMIGLSQLLAVWSAALLVLSVNELSKEKPHGWNVPVQAGAASAAWFLAEPLALPLPMVLYTGLAASALLKGGAFLARSLRVKNKRQASVSVVSTWQPGRRRKVNANDGVYAI